MSPSEDELNSARTQSGSPTNWSEVPIDVLFLPSWLILSLSNYMTMLQCVYWPVALGSSRTNVCGACRPEPTDLYTSAH